MNINDRNMNDQSLDDQLDADLIIDDAEGAVAPATPASSSASPAAANPAARLPQMMRRIPVTLTLEVGSARISLAELMDIGPASVLPLDSLAGEPLVIKVNGEPIGRAEVVVTGEQYGLKVIDLDGLNLDLLSR